MIGSGTGFVVLYSSHLIGFVLKRLIELVDLITRNKVKSIEIIADNVDSDTKLMQLYRGISTGKIQNDREAFAYLYPQEDNKNGYYKLKHVLTERLRNTLFFIDVKKNKFSNIKRAYLECQKLMAHFNLLLTKGARTNALYTGEKALRIAEEYEFTQEIISLARSLAANYASIAGDRKKYRELSEKVFANKEIFLAETMAEMLYIDLLSLYVKDKSTKPHVYQLAQDYLQQLEPYRRQVRSSNFTFCVDMLRAIRHMSVNDYKQGYTVTQQALQKVRAYRFFNTRAFGTLSFQYIACCIQLKKHREGVHNIRELIAMVDPGTFNWYKIQRLHFILSLHTGNYQEAYLIYRRVRKEKSYGRLVSNTRETWVIYGAWIYLLRATGKIRSKEQGTPGDFRIQKFLNEVPTFSRDKKGLNVPILIAHIFLLLKQGKYDIILDRFEAIEKYKGRYLDHRYNLRSSLFIDMLLQVPKCDFRRRRIERATRILSRRLRNTPLEVANQSHDLEILPYETAWEMLLELLS